MLLHVSRSERVPVDPHDVYLIEASGDHSLVRLRAKEPVEDTRPIGEVFPLFEPFGFVRIHREFAVNITRIRRIRFQADGRDWEVKMEPPVNRLLPVARNELDGLWVAFGEE